MANEDSTSNTPLKQCSRKDKCVNPLGCWLPATAEYFNPDKRKKSGLGARCRACTNEWSRQYAKRFPDKKRETQKKSRLKHPETGRRSAKKYADTHKELLQEKRIAKYWEDPDLARKRVQDWREANPEANKAINKRSYEKNKEKKLAQHKQWRLNNIEAARAYDKEYRKNNREKLRVKGRNNKARRKAAEGRFTTADIEIMYRTQKGRCWYCQVSLENTGYHIEHRIPITRGGSNWPSNLALACPKCNYAKSNKLPHEWIGRLI